MDQNVVLKLLAPFNHSGRNITLENFFTDMILAATLLQNGFTLVGIMRRNKAFIPPDFFAIGHYIHIELLKV